MLYQITNNCYCGVAYYEDTPAIRADRKKAGNVLYWSDVVPQFAVRWNRQEEEAIPVELTLDELKMVKRSTIAAARYARETAGTTVNGITIDTGRDSQALITGAALAAVIDSHYSLNWKTAAGFIHLTATEIIAVAQAVRAHVQSCFDREGELVALVDAAQTAEELDEIIISWPV